MENKIKKHSWYSTAFWVNTYVIMYILLTALSCMPRILAQIFIETQGVIPEWLPTSVSIPLDIFSWGLLIITSVYSGLDRASYAVKSTMTEIGAADMGDPAKIRVVIYWLGIIFVESYLLNFFFGKPFPPDAFHQFPGADIPLTETATALVSAISIYIGGNKTIRLVSNIDGTEKGYLKHDNERESTIVREHGKAMREDNDVPEWNDGEDCNGKDSF